MAGLGTGGKDVQMVSPTLALSPICTSHYMPATVDGMPGGNRY